MKVMDLAAREMINDKDAIIEAYTDLNSNLPDRSIALEIHP
jgi:hypothetical protein